MHRQRCYITPRPRFPHHCCLINHVLFPRNLSRQAKKRPLCNLFLWLKNNRNASGVQAENKHLHLCHLKMEFLPISLFLSTYLLLVQHLIVSISCSCALRQAKPQKIGYWRHWSLKKDFFFFKCKSYNCCVLCMWWQYNSHLFHLLFPVDTQLQISFAGRFYGSDNNLLDFPVSYYLV